MNSNPRHKPLPVFLRDLIACPPQHGQGVHQWLFKLARQLHAHRSPEDIADLLAGALDGCGRDGCGRDVPRREIEDAITSSANCAWIKGKPNTPVRPGTPSPKLPKRPKVDTVRRGAVIAENSITLEELRRLSPTPINDKIPDAEWFIDQLFPGNPLLCVGRKTSKFSTKTREEFRGLLSEMSLIVPSPMISKTGARKSDGAPSAHTLDNTGPRRFLVVEFDSGAPEEQVAIIKHLSEFAPLVTAVSSGGKSIHSWWDCRGVTEAKHLRFFHYAVLLGADQATWTRSQFVRLPGGWRHEKSARQEVLYFDHNHLATDGGKEGA